MRNTLKTSPPPEQGTKSRHKGQKKLDKTAKRGYSKKAKHDWLPPIIGDYAKTAVDIGKLIFGSLVLGTAMNGGFDQSFLFLIGSLSSSILMIAGVWLSSKIRKE